MIAPVWRGVWILVLLNPKMKVINLNKQTNKQKSKHVKYRLVFNLSLKYVNIIL